MSSKESNEANVPSSVPSSVPSIPTATATYSTPVQTHPSRNKRTTNINSHLVSRGNASASASGGSQTQTQPPPIPNLPSPASAAAAESNSLLNESENSHASLIPYTSYTSSETDAKNGNSDSQEFTERGNVQKKIYQIESKRDPSSEVDLSNINAVSTEKSSTIVEGSSAKPQTLVASAAVVSEAKPYMAPALVTSSTVSTATKAVHDSKKVSSGPSTGPQEEGKSKPSNHNHSTESNGASASVSDTGGQPNGRSKGPTRSEADGQSTQGRSEGASGPTGQTASTAEAKYPTDSKETPKSSSPEVWYVIDSIKGFTRFLEFTQQSKEIRQCVLFITQPDCKHCTIQKAALDSFIPKFKSVQQVKELGILFVTVDQKSECYSEVLKHFLLNVPYYALKMRPIYPTKYLLVRDDLDGWRPIAQLGGFRLGPEKMERIHRVAQRMPSRAQKIVEEESRDHLLKFFERSSPGFLNQFAKNYPETQKVVETLLMELMKESNASKEKPKNDSVSDAKTKPKPKPSSDSKSQTEKKSVSKKPKTAEEIIRSMTSHGHGSFQLLLVVNPEAKDIEKKSLKSLEEYSEYVRTFKYEPAIYQELRKNAENLKENKLLIWNIDSSFKDKSFLIIVQSIPNKRGGQSFKFVHIKDIEKTVQKDSKSWPEPSEFKTVKPPARPKEKEKEKPNEKSVTKDENVDDDEGDGAEGEGEGEAGDENEDAEAEGEGEGEDTGEGEGENEEGDGDGKGEGEDEGEGEDDS